MNALPVIPAKVPSTAFDPAAPVPEEYDVFCHSCGYSLVGLAGDRCPECGTPFNPNELPYARVPWLHRRRIGRIRAYWRTVRQVVLGPQAFSEELCRPVRISAADARRFRHVTIYLAATSGLVGTLAVMWINGVPFRGPPGEVAFGLGMLAGWWLAAVVFLRLATDMPVFIWKGLPSLPPSELAPLHHYAAAPLALAPLVMLVSGILPTLAVEYRTPDDLQSLTKAVGWAAAVGWVLLLWGMPLALMKGATRCGPRRVALLGLYLPFHALLMAFLTALIAAVVVSIPALLYERYFKS